MFLIGIDYSAQEGNIGLAAGRLNGDSLKVEFAKCPGTHAEVEKQIIAWINQEKKNGGVLIAIDAPLGWPKSLSRSLCWHKAGRALSTPADQMFDRKTDRWVHENIGKKPLSVGADKIARMGYAALSFLLRLRNATGCTIPLAWKPGCVKGISAIEVYPAATLKGRNISPANCKGKEGREKQECIANWLEDVINRLGMDGVWPSEDLVKNRSVFENEHVFDAVLCVQAAMDFVKGNAVSPEDAEIDGVKVGLKLAKKEGWIWVRKPDDQTTVAPNEQAEVLSVESNATGMSKHKNPGNRNDNGQITIRETQWPGNDHNAKICILECEKCKFRYGVNGPDIWERKCPNCQDGRPCSRPDCPAVADGDAGNCDECRA